VLKKYHVALERALEQLVPVLQVGQHRQRLRGELVHAGAEDVGHLAFVDEHRHLALAHGERGAVLDLVAGHREAPGQRAVAGSVHSMMSMNCFLMKSISAMACSPRATRASAQYPGLQIIRAGSAAE
jgi:hypothetical protein